MIVRSKEIALSDACVAQFSPDEYLFPEVFQPLSKQGVTEKQLDSFLAQNFGVGLAKTKTVYSLTSSPANCAGPVMEFFQVGDRILIPVGATFHSYVKADAPKLPAPAPAVASIAAGYKVTPLPMDYERYNNTCRPKIVGRKGKPQTTELCAPDYFPYVAEAKRGDALMDIIGNHDYERAGQEYAGGFSPPFRQKAAATFLVFPPFKQVTLVRVDDFEVVRNEERDVMSGVYLSIAGGKVVDQISGCHFNRDYVCLEEGRPVARLTETGKFQRQ
ncbi:hypothetical protein GCM10011572_40740 [Pseudoduganella buxea]|uniref:Uncharacterized protein n=1 Tax=Pseudoduganella buxea TaxID=1949069 RepID=A0ABQ1L3Q0_9BURK|nr:hypothetical protein GCM10011572_40740 [Pseudoduganella buxea]